MNDINITFYLSAMVYLNYPQAKLRPDRDNHKFPTIIINILHRCNVPIQKKWNLHSFASDPVSAATLILLPPRKRRCIKIHHLNPRIPGDPPQTIVPYPVHMTT